MAKFYLEGPGGIPGVKLAGEVRTAKPFYAEGGLTVAGATAVPAGGSSAAGLSIATAGPGVYVGSGAPTLTAAKGSLYLRADGSSTSTRAYINTDGAATWTAVTTAA
jgi:hypothetical protein